MHLQVFGQIGDSMGEQTDLNFRGAGIGIVLFVFFNQSFFGFRCIGQCSVLLDSFADDTKQMSN
jgi:hypothetical protein